MPHGKYSNPRICDEATLKADSELLQKVEILCGDFAQTGKYAGQNVLYYFDPPYRPLTETSAFTSYATGGFDDAEQTRLRDFCDEIAGNKSMFVASNSDPQNVDSEHSFIFYTPEGRCISPSDDVVENYQILGFAKGITIDDAFLNLLDENQWIDEMGYDYYEIITRELK